MQAVPRNIADKFAHAFADGKVGFSAKQITEYFTRYSNLVKPHDHYGMNPTRYALFIESVYALNPKQQYYALNDLTWSEYPSKYPYPDEAKRRALRHQLHSFISPSPVGLSFSKVRATAFREDWMTAYGRLTTNPAAAITAARTLLETTLKTIVAERGETPDDSGELGRLLKQAEDVLKFSRGERQAEHQILSGFTNIINGIAAISNAAGDRHGLVAGTSIDDPYLADLVVHAAGVVGLAFIDLHLLSAAAAAG